MAGIRTEVNGTLDGSSVAPATTDPPLEGRSTPWPSRRFPTDGRLSDAPAVEAMHILWITAGLGCDGDSIAITAATQPSLEDLVLGAIPGLPEVRLHHPVLAYENGDEFLESWYRAAEGRLDPFLLVVEGSIPDERTGGEGYWAAVGVDRQTGQPITTCEWIDRLAPQGLGRGRGRDLRRLRRHPRHGGQPDRLHGPARLPGLGLAIEGGPADRLRARLPGAAGQLHGGAALPAQPGGGPGADDPAGRAPAAGLAVRPDRPRGLRPGRLLRAGRLRRRARARPSASSSSAAGGRWCSATSASGAGWPASAAAPTSAASASAAPCRASPTSSCRSRRCRPGRSSPRRRSPCTARRSGPCGSSPGPR